MTTNLINNTVPTDFTVTKSAAASVVASTVEHLTDAANSQACQIISVAGSTADDPYTRVAIGTTATYALGIDNSDSDKFKITYHADAATPSSTALLTSTIAGEVNKPLQPTCLAQQAVRANITGDGTLYTLSLGHAEIYDVGNILASGTLTAPVTGKYMLGGNVTLAGVDQDNLEYQVILSTSNREYFTKLVKMWSPSNPTTKEFASHFSILADMDSADTANVRMKASGGNKTYDLTGTEYTYFYGDLVL